MKIRAIKGVTLESGKRHIERDEILELNGSDFNPINGMKTVFEFYKGMNVTIMLEEENTINIYTNDLSAKTPL